MPNAKIRAIQGFQFQPFSAKQMKLINWWAEDSPVKDKFMCISDGSVRSGKELINSAKLYTADGYKLMGDIRVGDYVLDRLGRPTQVVGVFPQGIKDVYKITFHDGSSCECGKEHLWGVWKYSTYNHGNKELSVVATNELLNTDLNTNRPKYLFPLNGCVQFNSRDVKIDAYLLGLLLGDGCFSNKSCNISITNSEQDIIDYCTSVTDEYSICLYNNSSKIKYIGKYNKNLISNLIFYGLYSKLPTEKFIPVEYKYNSKEVRLKILAGIINTDGNIKVGTSTVRYGTVSKQLLHDVVEVARSLGMYVIEHDKKEFNNDKRNTYYSCSINPTKELFSLLSIKHRTNGVEKQRYKAYRTIKSIEYVGKDECTCIYVDNEEHLYLTDDFIVTHNTISICLSFLLYVMSHFNHQMVAMAGKSVGSVRRNLLVPLKGMLMTLGYEYIEHRSENYLEIMKGNVTNYFHLFGLSF